MNDSGARRTGARRGGEPRARHPGDDPGGPVPGIALCLSGGGYRAMLFHLGALWRLNELGYLPRLDRVSSVSGGSITAGALAHGWSTARVRRRRRRAPASQTRSSPRSAGSPARRSTSPRDPARRRCSRAASRTASPALRAPPVRRRDPAGPAGHGRASSSTRRTSSPACSGASRSRTCGTTASGRSSTRRVARDRGRGVVRVPAVPLAAAAEAEPGALRAGHRRQTSQRAAVHEREPCSRTAASTTTSGSRRPGSATDTSSSATAAATISAEANVRDELGAPDAPRARHDRQPGARAAQAAGRRRLRGAECARARTGASGARSPTSASRDALDLADDADEGAAHAAHAPQEARPAAPAAARQLGLRASATRRCGSTSSPAHRGRRGSPTRRRACDSLGRAARGGGRRGHARARHRREPVPVPARQDEAPGPGGRETFGLRQARTPATSAFRFARWLADEYRNAAAPLGIRPPAALAVGVRADGRARPRRAARRGPARDQGQRRPGGGRLVRRLRDQRRERRDPLRGRPRHPDVAGRRRDRAAPGLRPPARSAARPLARRRRRPQGHGRPDDGPAAVLLRDACRVRPEAANRFQTLGNGVGLQNPFEGAPRCSAVYFAPSPSTEALGEAGRRHALRAGAARLPAPARRSTTTCTKTTRGR